MAGQLRAYHAVRVLEAVGHVVDRVSVFSSAHYPTAGDEPPVDLEPARSTRWRT
jgi:hypothetical protein